LFSIIEIAYVILSCF